MASNNDSNDINILNSIVMNDDRFLSLLEKLIGESVHLQNNPAQGMYHHHYHYHYYYHYYHYYYYYYYYYYE
jgi:hypothetical protein